jgi:hypothetical protein
MFAYWSRIDNAIIGLHKFLTLAREHNELSFWHVICAMGTVIRVDSMKNTDNTINDVIINAHDLLTQSEYLHPDCALPIEDPSIERDELLWFALWYNNTQISSLAYSDTIEGATTAAALFNRIDRENRQFYAVISPTLEIIYLNRMESK